MAFSVFRLMITKKSDIYTKTNLLVGSWPLLILTERSLYHTKLVIFFKVTVSDTELISLTVAGFWRSLNCDPLSPSPIGIVAERSEAW